MLWDKMPYWKAHTEKTPQVFNGLSAMTRVETNVYGHGVGNEGHSL